jgi:hypothetical protein
MTLNITITALLALAALVIAIMASLNKAPLYVAVILLAILELLHLFPR